MRGSGSDGPVSEGRIGAAMTLGDLCQAGPDHSDTTATNRRINRIGGPQSVTDVLRAIRAPVSRLDRRGPEGNRSAPSDAGAIPGTRPARRRGSPAGPKALFHRALPVRCAGPFDTCNAAVIALTKAALQGVTGRSARAARPPVSWQSASAGRDRPAPAASAPCACAAGSRGGTPRTAAGNPSGGAPARRCPDARACSPAWQR